MKKFTLILALVMGMFASVDAEKRVTFENYDYCEGGEFNRVSDNGKYVVGASGISFAAFAYIVEKDSIFCLNPEWEDASPNAHLVSATAMDVSDAGIIVGQYAFDDTYRRPAIFNLNTESWAELEVPEKTKTITEVGSYWGEATCISADGKYIGGYVISHMDNGTSRRNVPCVWVRTNDDETAPVYALQMPIDTEEDKIHCNGDWAWHISNDGRWLGGVSSAVSGCLNVGIWENKFDNTLLERTWLIGKEDWIRTEDDTHDGIIDDEDGGDTTICQYVWEGQVSCISPSGEWIVGYHNYNGTGIIPDEVAATGVKSYSFVGFRYNTKTKELTDSLPFGLPAVVFDDGEMIYREGETAVILSSSQNKEVQCGSYVISVEGLGAMNMPMLLFPFETGVENVKDLDVNVFVNNSTLYVDGEFTSVEVYSVLGALMGSYTENEISLDNMNKGVYVVRIINGNQATTKKINL